MATATTDTAKRRKVRSHICIMAVLFNIDLLLKIWCRGCARRGKNMAKHLSLARNCTCGPICAREASTLEKPFLLQVETMIRSCLISAKEGVGLRVFANDFVSLCGEEVPFREFGMLAGCVIAAIENFV